MDKNPFSVLGLDPSALRGLTDQQVEELVKKMAKIMQTFCHPDIAKNPVLRARSIEINRAIELLNRKKYPDAWDEYKRSFLKKTPLRKRIEQLSDLIAKSEKKENLYCEKIANILVYQIFEARSNNCGESERELVIHNTWVNTGGFSWVPKKDVSTCRYFLDDIGIVLNSPSLLEKAVVGVIDEGYFINNLIRELKLAYESLSNERLIAGTMAMRNGKSNYRGPVIGRDNYKLVVPHIDFFAPFKKGAYVVTINRRGKEEIFFQIDGSVK